MQPWLTPGPQAENLSTEPGGAPGLCATEGVSRNGEASSCSTCGHLLPSSGTSHTLTYAIQLAKSSHDADAGLQLSTCRRALPPGPSPRHVALRTIYAP